FLRHEAGSEMAYAGEEGERGRCLRCFCGDVVQGCGPTGGLILNVVKSCGAILRHLVGRLVVEVAVVVELGDSDALPILQLHHVIHVAALERLYGLPFRGGASGRCRSTLRLNDFVGRRNLYRRLSSRRRGSTFFLNSGFVVSLGLSFVLLELVVDVLPPLSEWTVVGQIKRL